MIALMAGATTAYFSDNEQSTGNIFVAGAIDLRVDHTLAMYNDLICSDGTWQPVCLPTGNNLIVNGDFESPTVTDLTLRQLFPDGTVGLGWRVFRASTNAVNSLELMRGFNSWPAASGQQHAELDGTVSTYVTQDIVTVPGSAYRLSYAFSPRPNTISTENRLRVHWGGTIVATQGPVTGSSTTIWTQYTHTLVATTSLTRVRFTDLGSSNGSGTFLDNVSLYRIVCTESAFIGTPCQTWQEKDLAGEQFFQFNDIKPGDRGRDVISLHVYDNDAYACLLVASSTDAEGTYGEVEIAADDTSSTTGELGAALAVFYWYDLDGDGEYEPLLGETEIETGTMQDTVIGLFEPASTFLRATTTAYVGLAWCAGEQAVDVNGIITCSGSALTDEIQTDMFSANIELYAEQMRNNADFSCAARFAQP